LYSKVENLKSKNKSRVVEKQPTKFALNELKANIVKVTG